MSVVGISTNQWWLLIGVKVGIDYEFNPAVVPDGLWPEDSGLAVNLKESTVTVRTQNADLHFSLLPEEVSVSVMLKER